MYVMTALDVWNQSPEDLKDWLTRKSEGAPGLYKDFFEVLGLNKKYTIDWIIFLRKTVGEMHLYWRMKWVIASGPVEFIAPRLHFGDGDRVPRGAIFNACVTILMETTQQGQLFVHGMMEEVENKEE